jgi:hypothetical protein
MATSMHVHIITIMTVAISSAAAMRRAPASSGKTFKDAAFDKRASDRLLHMDEVNQETFDGYLSERGRWRRKFLQASSFMGALAAVEPWFAKLARAQGGRRRVAPAPYRRPRARGSLNQRDGAARCLRQQPRGWPAMTVDCLAGHIGFEPANPSASYLIGIARQLPLRAAQLRRRRPFECELRDTDFCSLAKISAVDLLATNSVRRVSVRPPQLLPTPARCGLTARA